MTTTAGAFEILVRVRRASVVVLLAAAAALWVDRSSLGRGLALLAMGTALACSVIEVFEPRVRRRVRADSEELEERRVRDREVVAAEVERRIRIERVVDGKDSPQPVYQPIVDLASGRVVGYEGLSRFHVGRPDEWFAEAAQVGLGVDLELKAVQRALAHLDDLPGDQPYLSVNVSPETLMSARLRKLLARVEPSRIVLELTEQVSIGDYVDVVRAARSLRRSGIRLAVDDAGAGHASLRHIATLEPDIIKLDRSFTAALSSNAAERHMVTALVGFAGSVGASVIAEGIETARGLRAALSLGIATGQGWHLGVPQSIEELLGEETEPVAVADVA